jgi:hypothetical protein
MRLEAVSHPDTHPAGPIEFIRLDRARCQPDRIDKKRIIRTLSASLPSRRPRSAAFQSLAMADNSGFGSSAGLRLHVDPGVQIPSPGTALNSYPLYPHSTTSAFDPSPSGWNWNLGARRRSAGSATAPSPQQTPTDNPTGPEPGEPAGESPTPMNSPPTVSLIRFPDDLATAGWQAGESGGTEPGIGTVTAAAAP